VDLNILYVNRIRLQYSDIKSGFIIMNLLPKNLLICSSKKGIKVYAHKILSKMLPDNILAAKLRANDTFLAK